MAVINKEIKKQEEELKKIKELVDELDNTTSKTINVFLKKYEQELNNLKNNKDINKKMERDGKTFKMILPLISLLNFLMTINNNNKIFKLFSYTCSILDIAMIPFINKREKKFKELYDEYDKYEDIIKNNLIRIMNKTKSKEIKNKINNILDKFNNTQNETISKLLIESVELLNEENLFEKISKKIKKPIDIYNVSIFDKPEKNHIFGLLNKNDAILDYLEAHYKKDKNDNYIENKNSFKFNFYIYKYKILNYKLSEQSASNNYSRKMYYVDNEKDIISSSLVQKINSLKELASIIDKDIIEVNDTDKRKKILSLSLEKLNKYKSKYISVLSKKYINNFDNFINGDDDEIMIAIIKYDETNQDEGYIIDKEIQKIIKEINSDKEISKYAKLTDDGCKLDWYIYLEWK